MIDKENQEVAAESGDIRLDDLDAGGSGGRELQGELTGTPGGPQSPQQSEEAPDDLLFPDACEDDLDRWDDLVPDLVALVVEETAKTAQRYVIRDRSREMSFCGGPASQTAEATVEALISALGLDCPGTKPTSIVARRIALGTFLADLLLIGRNGVWSNRSLKDGDFKDTKVGRRAFRPVMEALQRARLIDVLPGYRGTQGLTIGARTTGRQTRFRPTPRLLRFLEASGVPLDALLDHFTPGEKDAPRSQDLLQLRGTKPKRTSRELKQKAPTLPIDPADPVAIRLRSEVEEINTFLRSCRIDGFAFPGLCRIFNEGDKVATRWRRGGRFYCLPGGGDYMAWKGKKEARAAGMRLQGEEVVEVDLQACHLTIFYALMGEPFDNTIDPYEVPEVPRKSVKDWVTFALGSGTIIPKNADWYWKVRSAALARHPILRRLDQSRLNSLDFQFHEAEVMKRAMGFLRRFGVPSLPVHDSLIIPRSAREDAKGALTIAFASYFRELMPDGPPITPRVV